jgi:hypothetical protein
MADEWGSWFGTAQLPDASWQFSMPESGDLLKCNPTLTGAGLQQLMDLGDVGRYTVPGMPTGRSDVLRDPGTLYYSRTPGYTPTAEPPDGAGAGGGAPEGFFKGASSRMLQMICQNPAAFLALMSGAGAGVAGALKGSDKVKLPGDVRSLAARATAPAQPDPYAEAELDRQMRRDIGPGWETSPPGIQAKQAAAYQRQKGDREAALGGLGTIGQLYAAAQTKKDQEQRNLFSLAGTLGMLGLGGLGGLGDFGYSR